MTNLAKQHGVQMDKVNHIASGKFDKNGNVQWNKNKLPLALKKALGKVAKQMKRKKNKSALTSDEALNRVCTFIRGAAAVLCGAIIEKLDKDVIGDLWSIWIESSWQCLDKYNKRYSLNKTEDEDEQMDFISGIMANWIGGYSDESQAIINEYTKAESQRIDKKKKSAPV